MKQRHGFTVVELLIAITILAIVLALASQGIITSLKAKSSQESLVSAQEKARRIAQVISQDVRGSVFGAIIDKPYTSTTQNVSFLVLDGGAGFNVTAVGTNQFTVSSSLNSTTDLGSTGDSLLVVTNNSGFLFKINNITGSGNTYQVTYNACVAGVSAPAISASAPALMFRVKRVGYRYNSTTRTLFRQINDNTEEVVAFDLKSANNGFGYDIDYVYAVNDGSSTTLTTSIINPIRRSGINTAASNTNPPVTTLTAGGQTYTLTRLQFGIGVAGQNFNRKESERDITTTIELSGVNNQRFTTLQQGVNVCN
jgi:prepilin-type N-terminal cleavage/methylation domain-containing protein